MPRPQKWGGGTKVRNLIANNPRALRNPVIYIFSLLFINRSKLFLFTVVAPTRKNIRFLSAPALVLKHRKI
jgi:hypothetical protein